MFTKSTSAFPIVIALGLFATAFISCNEPEDTGEAPAVQTPPTGDHSDHGDQNGHNGDMTEGTPPAGGTEGAQGQPETSSAGGRDIFADANCTMCHGAGLGGSALGPALENLSNNWDAARLQQYLLDPVGYAAADARLSGQSEQYSMPMPAWNPDSFTQEQLDTLIAWLLEQ